MNAATREDIEAWIKKAAQEGAAYMIVVCDGFEYEDYPVHCANAKEYFEKVKEIRGAGMQSIMEVYDLSLPIAEQLSEHRANHPPKGAPGE